jgi:hypothetical protein
MAAYSAIDDSSAHFQVLLYTGNSSSTTSADRTITNDGNSDLQPDLLALWNRDTTANSGSRWWDSTRGVGQNKGIQSSSSGAEGGGNDPEFGYVNTFHSDGFGVRAGANDANGRWTTDRGEGGGDRYVAMQWKANGGSTTAVSESGSGDGAINACTYQANTTSGLSIISYTGLNDQISNGQHTKVTHGLSSAPTFVIIKQTNANNNWQVLGNNLGGFNDYHLHLNTTDARSGTTHVSSTAPDTNYVYVGNHDDVNDNGDTYLMYAFHDVQGFSRFGKYKGNGVHNGIFCYCGFKPAMVIIKNFDQTEPWLMYDNERPGYNEINKKLGAGSYYAENAVPGAGDSAYNEIDIYSNGFKMTSNNGATNADDKNFVFYAWAANPLVTSDGVPSVGF